MTIPFLLPSILVGVGAVFLAASIFLNVKNKDVPPDLLKKWKTLSGLMVFFLAGYVVFLVLLLSNRLSGLEYLTSAVFFGGAFFVLLVIRLTSETIRRINAAKALLLERNEKLQEENRARLAVEDELQKANEFLEERVRLRTRELFAVNEQLQREITGRKKIEQQITMSHAELDQIFNTSADGMRVVDRNFTIVRANRVFQKMVGLGEKDIVGRKCFEIFTGEQCHTENCSLSLVFASRERIEYEVEKTRSDGTRLYCIVTATPFLSPEGDFLGIVEDYRDISDRKEAEEKLVDANRQLRERNSELEQAHGELKAAQSLMLQREKMASIGQLAAGVAHEINNPVGFVASNLATLARYTGNLLDYINFLTRELRDDRAEFALEQREKFKIDYIMEDVRDLIRESLDGVERVNKIVQGLKGFSRVDEAERQPADINQCLDETINIIGNELKYKANVHKRYGELPLTICHPRQLNQVFLNFLINACQAIDKKGDITISTQEDNGWIFVSIADTGCGIAPENLARIFEPFFTTKEVGQGTGLGLSISYDIIKKHGGDIMVDSEPGKGTAFTIKIPVVAK